MAGPQNNAQLLDPMFMRKLERLALSTRAVHQGSTKGERRSRRKGSSTEFADYRNYVQGDDLRHVDWNIYGRLGQLYLKLFEDMEDLTLHLVIDASRSMAYGTPAKLDFAKRFAAAVGYVGLSGYDRVAATILSGDTMRAGGPWRGRANAPRLFSFLSSAEPEGSTGLENSLKRAALPRRGKGVAVLVSDFLDEAGPEGWARVLAGSCAEAYAVQVLAPEEIAPDLSGDLKLIDCETGEATEISVSQTLLKRYHKRREEFQESVRRACLSRDMGYFMASSNVPLEELVIESLRRGGMLR